MDGPQAPRYHSLDALRAAMMLLGLVLHSAASYTLTPLGINWPYQDRQTSGVFDLLIFFIHLFRMPVFFVVAGFFAGLLYHRNGPAGFARNRATRVLLPLVLFWPVVTPLVGLAFLFSVGTVGGASPFDLIDNYPVLQQPLLGHLWFLYYLVLLYALVLCLVPLAARLPARLRRLGRAWGDLITTQRPGVVVLAGLTALTLMPMEAPGLDTVAAVIPAPRIVAAYGVFFAFGWSLFRRRETIQSFGATWKASLAAGFVASIANLYVLVARPIADPTLWRLAAIALAGLSMWLLIFGLLGIFVRHIDRQRPVVRYLSDASYWMYLVHLPAAAFFPGLLAQSTAPAFVKFAAVLALTAACSGVTYHYLVRSTVLGELLNGRRYPRSLPVPVRAAGEPIA